MFLLLTLNISKNHEICRLDIRKNESVLSKGRLLGIFLIFFSCFLAILQMKKILEKQIIKIAEPLLDKNVRVFLNSAISVILQGFVEKETGTFSVISRQYKPVYLLKFA